jgi:hypothetical protein
LLAFPSGEIIFRTLFYLPNPGRAVAAAGGEERTVVIEGNGVDRGFVAKIGGE